MAGSATTYIYALSGIASEAGIAVPNRYIYRRLLAPDLSHVYVVLMYLRNYVLSLYSQHA